MANARLNSSPSSEVAQIRNALANAAAIMRGIQSDVAHHTDLSPEIDACEAALALEALRG